MDEPSKGPTAKTNQRTVLIFAGEISGDTYGALLAEELLKLSPDLSLVGGGGDSMAKAGINLLYTIDQISAMGLTEIISALPRLMRVKNEVLDYAKQEKPALAIFIDYPGFHVRMAKKLKTLGIPVLYYISPKVWAWREKRIKKVIASIDAMAAIFEFEPELYRRYGFNNTTFVGHPIADVASRQKINALEKKPGKVIGLLPGSRNSEISRLLPILSEVIKTIKQKHPNCAFRLGASPSISDETYNSYLGNSGVELVRNNLYGLIDGSDLLLSASGTVNLEVAWLQKPAVITYKMAEFTAFILKFFLKIPYVSPVNIMAQKEIYPEFLQDNATSENIANKALTWLDNEDELNKVTQSLKHFRETIGATGASEKTAKLALSMIGNN